MKAILIMGSTSDEPHAKKITDKLDKFNIASNLTLFIQIYDIDLY